MRHKSHRAGGARLTLPGFLLGMAACLAAGLAAGLSGCLEESDPQRCARKPPLGGNPIGTWEVLDVCADPQMPYYLEVCPAARIELVGAFAKGGTIEFGADNSYKDSIILGVSQKLEAPLSCFPRFASCYELGLELAKNTTEELASKTSTVEKKAFCRGTNGQCKCAMDMTTTFKETSTYTVTGNTYKIASEDFPTEFSVVGNEMRIQTGEVTGRLLRK